METMPGACVKMLDISSATAGLIVPIIARANKGRNILRMRAMRLAS